MRIPTRTLRFDASRDPQSWGVNFIRRVRRVNETSYWAPLERQYRLHRMSRAGTLEGLSGLRQGRNLQVKPYVLGSSVRNTGGATFDHTLNGGLDVKYGVTPALTLDVTARPDFAQAEADEQTVNLTQFSQFFPEKRGFFLENAGLFYVGDAARNNRVNPTPTPDEDLLLFSSRRIGLSSKGAAIPIMAGGRLTGRAAGFTVGALNVQTEEDGGTAANNHSVLRARRNGSGSSDVGALFMPGQSRENRGVREPLARLQQVVVPP